MGNRFLKRDDSGMSMVELIVVVMISALLLTVIATMFGNSLNVQQRATERDLATGKANAAELQFTNALRNAVSVTTFPQTMNSSSKPQTQINLTHESDDVLLCQVWIWDDLADGTTALTKRSYQSYPSDPVSEPLTVAVWSTESGNGFHMASNSTVTGPQPAEAHFTFDVGGVEGDTSVVVSGGGIKQALINTSGLSNPCAPGW